MRTRAYPNAGRAWGWHWLWEVGLGEKKKGGLRRRSMLPDGQPRICSTVTRLVLYAELFYMLVYDHTNEEGVHVLRFGRYVRAEQK